MAIPLVYLTDSSNQVWELGVLDDGAYTTTPVSGTGLNYILLQDTCSNQIWKMIVLTSGALQIIPYFGTGIYGILVESPSGYLYNIVITNSAISTIYNANLIAIINGAFQDPFGNPYSYGTIVLETATPFINNNSLILSECRGILDQNGNVVPFSAYPGIYFMRVYKANGELVWYTPLTIPNSSPVNLGSLVPQQ